MKRAFLLAMFAGGLCAVQTPAPVKVEGGSIQGTVEEGLTVYRGIPFAAPPVGDLRWRAPEAAAKWDGVKAAAQFGPKCIQPGAVDRWPKAEAPCWPVAAPATRAAAPCAGAPLPPVVPPRSRSAGWRPPA